MTHLLLIGLILVLATLLCSLGFWQLSRAHYKEGLLNLAGQASIQKPLTNNDLLTKTTSATARYLPVYLKGKLLNEYTILLDNKINNGQVGYEVLVPLLLEDQQVIFINRGWIPLGSSRTILPFIKPLPNEIVVEGYLDFAYRNPLIKQSVETYSIQWPLRMQQFDKELLQTRMHKNINPMLVNLNKDSPYALVISPRKVGGLTPEKHLGYAIQWFALAVTLILLSIFTYFRHRGKHERPSTPY